VGIYIALGGSGIKSLAPLKAKIYAQYSDKSLFEQENTFLFIDTDVNDVAKIQSDPVLTKLYGNNRIIDLDEFIPLGKAVPFYVRKAAMDFYGKENEHLKSWCIMPGEGRYTPTQVSLANGSGAQRMDGRLSLFKSQHIVISAIERAIIKLKTIQPDLEALDYFDVSVKAPELWVITGTNGGTGSAIALDVLFILDRLYYKHLMCEPIKKLALIAPEAFVSMPENRFFTHSLNSFAFMWELNELKMSSDKEGLMSKLFVTDYFDNDCDYNTEPFDPYSYALMFDTESTSGVKISLNSVFDNVASVLFKLTSTSRGRLVDSMIRNRLSDRTIEPSRPIASGCILDNTEWSKSIVAVGFKSIDVESEMMSNELSSDRLNVPIFYPSNTHQHVNYIFYFADEHTEIAKTIGYDEYDSAHLHQNMTEKGKIEVLAFETSHSFDTYSFFKNYANTYVEKRDEILSLDYACHIHKGFVHLNIDKALQGENSLLLDFAFYDAIISVMKIKNKELYNKLFFEEEVEDDPFSTELPLKFPLLKIDSSENKKTVVYKYLLFDENTNKLKIYMAGVEKFYNCENFSSFYVKTSILNEEFSISLSALNKWVKTNEAFIHSNFLAEHWTDILKLVAEKLSFPSFDERTLANKETIIQLKKQIEELRTQLVPQT
jgi:hypothetical protein